MAKRAMPQTRTESISIPDGDEPVRITYADNFGGVFFAVITSGDESKVIDRVVDTILAAITDVAGATVVGEDGTEIEIRKGMNVAEYNRITGASYRTWKDAFRDSYAPHLFKLATDLMGRNNLLGVPADEKEKFEGN